MAALLFLLILDGSEDTASMMLLLVLHVDALLRGAMGKFFQGDDGHLRGLMCAITMLSVRS